MDNGLVPAIAVLFLSSTGLNPCCSGQYFHTDLLELEFADAMCLNPCCSGQYFHTRPYKTILIINKLKSSIKQTFTFLDRKRTIS